VPLVAALVAAVVAFWAALGSLHLVHRFGVHPPHASEVAERTGLVALVRHRVGPLATTSLALTAATILIGLAVVAFGFAAIGATRTDLWWVDASMASWGESAAAPWSTVGLEVLTWLGGTNVVFGVALAAGLFDLRRRRRRRLDGLAFLVVVVVGQNLLANAIKAVVERQRPPVTPLTAHSGFSFPSGHTAAATATLVALALLFGRGRSRPVRLVLAGLAAALATAVAASRVLLGVHWVTDVIGGAAVGLVWVAAVAVLFGGRRLEYAAELPGQAEGSSLTRPGRPAGRRRRASATGSSDDREPSRGPATRPGRRQGRRAGRRA
jgi:undecaprenyl-diphosphatase